LDPSEICNSLNIPDLKDIDLIFRDLKDIEALNLKIEDAHVPPIFQKSAIDLSSALINALQKIDFDLTSPLINALQKIGSAGLMTL